jgi:hypothetical protein
MRFLDQFEVDGTPGPDFAADGVDGEVAAVVAADDPVPDLEQEDGRSGLALWHSAEWHKAQWPKTECHSAKWKIADQNNCV